MQTALCLDLGLLDHHFVGIKTWEAINAQEVDVSLLISDHLFDSELDLHSLHL